jgi:hypothetical protein
MDNYFLKYFKCLTLILKRFIIGFVCLTGILIVLLFFMVVGNYKLINLLL